ncbi:MAG: MFS transporter [Proteobacteria bacterium]|jgi:MFS transporter, PAT family, beta-lactamase induction signal transducer AmpG|nr:MFS transporter [Pseudomonadota bacterium]
MFEQPPVLAQSKWLRLITLCLLYVCQGLPIGIFQIALPAWFAAEGLTVSEIGGFIAIVFLPWGFKLVAGPVMDRFSFPAMGRRRPWILMAQMGIIGSFLLIALLSPDPKESYYLLAALGFMANFFGAAQDVAVDGMAIDILEENERAQANAYMFGGQAGGMSISGAVGSAALVSFGLSIAALIMAFAVFLIMLLLIILREREGERMLPWSEGEASLEALASVSESWRDIVVPLVRALVLPMSLLLVVLEGLQRAAGGIQLAINPAITVQQLGWAQTEYANWLAITGVVASVIGVVFAAMVDRAGLVKVLFAFILIRMLGFAIFAYSEVYWQNVEYFKAMLLLADITSQFVTMTVIALFMRLCLPQVAATQFAVYMASANLTRSLGSGAVVPLSDLMDYSQMFLLMAGLHLVFLLLLPLLNFQKHERDNATLLASLGKV